MTREKAQAVCRALTRAVVPRASVQSRGARPERFDVFVKLPSRTPAGHLERALKVAKDHGCEVWLEHDPLGLRICDHADRRMDRGGPVAPDVAGWLTAAIERGEVTVR